MGINKSVLLNETESDKNDNSLPLTSSSSSCSSSSASSISKPVAFLKRFRRIDTTKNRMSQFLMATTGGGAVPTSNKSNLQIIKKKKKEEKQRKLERQTFFFNNSNSPNNLQTTGTGVTVKNDSVENGQICKLNNKILTNIESDYTSINEYCSYSPLPKHNKEESFYESTFDMDLNLHKSKFNNRLIFDVNNNNLNRLGRIAETSPSSTDLYSEIILPSSKKTNVLHSLSHNSPNLIANFFQKLTKHASRTNVNANETKRNSRASLVLFTYTTNEINKPPVLPTKSFNPTIEFFKNDEKKDENIYFKIEKEAASSLSLSSSASSLSSVNEERCLNISHVPPTPLLETMPIISRSSHIEPLNINNQVYYSFTQTSSSSLNKFDLNEKNKSQTNLNKCLITQDYSTECIVKL